MKKTKKLMGLMLAVSMIPTMSVANAEGTAVIKGSYSDLPQDWNVTYFTENTSWNNEQDYAGISYGSGVDESNALYVNVDTPSEAHKYIKVTPKLAGGLEANVTYRISFDGKYVDTTGAFVARFNWLHEVNSTQFIADGDAGNGLTHYYKDVEIGATAPTTFDIYFDRKMAYVFDNLSIQKVVDGVPDGTEFIVGGDMEKIGYKFNVSDEKHGLSTDWYVLYREDNGEFDRTTDYFMPTKKYARNGDYAMYISNKLPKAAAGNTFFRLINRNAIKFEAGKYHYEFWAKASLKSNVSLISGILWLGDKHIQCTNMNSEEIDENGWTKYSAEFEISEEEAETVRTFSFLSEDIVNAVIDDVNLYNVNNPDVNLVQDGDFENSVRGSEADGVNEFDTGNKGRPWAIYGGQMNTADYYVEPSNKEAYSSEYSAHIVNLDKVYNGSRYVRLIRLFDKLPNKTYNISFYMKGGGEKVWIGTQWSDNDLISSYTKGETDENGWAKYSKTYTGEIDRFQVVAWVNANLYIDNVEIYATDDETKTNLVPHGDYEIDSFNKLKDEDTIIVNPMAYSSKDGKGLNISWTNPTNTGINDIDVYVGGTLVKNGINSLSPCAFNELYVGYLEPNKEYTVEIVMDINGEIVRKEIKGITDAVADPFERGGWEINRHRGITKKSAYREGQTYPDYPNVNINLDDKVSVSGSSMRFDVNLPATKANCYPHIYQYVTVRRDTPYLFKMKYKTDFEESVSPLFGITIEFWDRNEDGSVANKSWTSQWINPSADWTEFEFDLSSVKNADGSYAFCDINDTTGKTYEMRVLINCQKGIGSLWVDDVELYPLLKETTDSPDYMIFGDNMYTNSGFDYTYEIGTPVFKSGNTVLKNVTGGKVDVTAKIKNYAVDNLNGMVVVALYKDGKLVNTALVEKEISITPLVIPAEEITQNVVLPEDLSDGEYEIKVFCWDGTGSMKPFDVADVLVEE